MKRELIALLTRREYGYQELKRRMIGKGYEETAIEGELDALVKQGLQSDQRFAEAFCAHHAKQGKGPMKVRYELQRLQVSEADIDSVLAAYDWQEAYQLAKKRIMRLSPEKHARAWYAKGFSRDCLRDLASECEEEE